MIFSITTTHTPATDLGYLLHKRPDRFQSISLAYGEAHVFFPEVSPERCTAVLLLDIDPVGLVRKGGAKGNEGFSLQQYVNDRPYVASSFLSVAIAKAYGTAMAGRSKERQELADSPMPLTAMVSAVPDADGGELIRRLFEPLGYKVKLEGVPLDPKFPKWGQAPYYSVTLEGQSRLSELLSHLYVLIPVLDDQKHYWVGEAEIEKLLQRGEGWLAEHPERELITNRYLKYQRSLSQSALDRLLGDEATNTEKQESIAETAEQELETSLSLNQQRLEKVFHALKTSGASRVLDLGCGEGKLIQMLLDDPQFGFILGLDVSHRTLETAARRLHLDDLPESRRKKLDLIHGSLVYKDDRLQDFDACAIVEVIEHMDPHNLGAFERVVFRYAAPKTVVLTTPNREYNQLFESLSTGRFRHQDHRFEWTRNEFKRWANRTAQKYNYQVSFEPVGPVNEQYGPPTQMGVFSK